MDISIKNTIKHLVISGGGPGGFVTYGALKQTALSNMWRLSDIKSIYGCSIGAFIGIIVSLNYDWLWLDDYFINRPWEKIVSLNVDLILKFYTNKGILDETFICRAIKPLLSAKDLSENCTLRELYEFNKIDIHIYSTSINNNKLEKVDISHSSHPDMTVIRALSMSMAYPLVFKPVIIEEDCFIDGGLVNNFPLNDCIHQQKCGELEILAFKNIWGMNENKIKNDTDIFNFMIFLVRKMQASICSEKQQTDIKNIINCNINDICDLNDWYPAVSTPESRSSLVISGETQARDWIKQYKDNTLLPISE